MSKKIEPLEKDIENQLLDYLNKLRVGFFWKNQSTGLYDPTKKTFRKSHGKHLINGVSDIVGIMFSGRFVAIEVKRPSTRKRVSKDQEAFLEKIRVHNGIAGVAWDIESLDELLGLNEKETNKI